MDWKQQLDQAIDRRFEQMVAIRRHLHVHPEPSGFENETSLYLYQLLDEAGLAVRLGPEGRGVIIDDEQPGEGAPAGPCIAVRADIDALRIQDAKAAEYRSQNDGVMHACGHDSHTATVIGALLGLKSLEKNGGLPTPIRWRGILQPAEETSQGARQMIEAGALEGVRAILGLHVDPSRELGVIGIREGALTAACDEMEIRLSGRGGHAARPHESLDPIAAAAQLISSIYLFVPRAVDSQDPVVVTIGQIHGGDNPNVIPETVLLRGTVRTLGGAIREGTKDHIRQLARGLAEASGCQIEVRFNTGPPSVENDPQLTELLRAAGRDVLGPQHVDEIPRPSMGGEDFAYYLAQVPGSMFRLGIRSANGGGAPLHSPVFDIDEQAMRHGAKILARAVVSWSAGQLEDG